MFNLVFITVEGKLEGWVLILYKETKVRKKRGNFKTSEETMYNIWECIQINYVLS